MVGRRRWHGRRDPLRAAAAGGTQAWVSPLRTEAVWASEISSVQQLLVARLSEIPLVADSAGVGILPRASSLGAAVMREMQMRAASASEQTKMRMRAASTSEQTKMRIKAASGGPGGVGVGADQRRDGGDRLLGLLRAALVRILPACLLCLPRRALHLFQEGWL